MIFSRHVFRIFYLLSSRRYSSYHLHFLGLHFVRMALGKSSADGAIGSLGYIDTHCHLDSLFERIGYRGSFRSFMKEQNFPSNFEGCVAVFCEPENFKQESLWRPFLEESNVWGAFGCHPHHAEFYTDDVEKELSLALEHPKVRALGEIGLDYSNRNNCNHMQQWDVFRRQLRMAKCMEMNIVVHCREAHEDAIRIMKEVLPVDYRIHLHCFNDKYSWAERWMQEFPNLLIGITNVVTKLSATEVRDAVLRIPLSRLLLETDAPYFIPRSKPCKARFSNPGMAIHVAEEIASLKQVPLQDVIRATRNNTRKIYNI